MGGLLSLLVHVDPFALAVVIVALFVALAFAAVQYVEKRHGVKLDWRQLFVAFAPLALAGRFVGAQSLEIDLGGIWESINAYVPNFMQIYGPLIGIGVASALVLMIGAKIIQVFRTGNL